MIEMLAQIDGTSKGRPFVAGIVLWDDIVIEAAPILKFMAKGKWTRQQVRSFVGQKRWKISVVHQLERERPAWWRKPVPTKSPT